MRLLAVATIRGVVAVGMLGVLGAFPAVSMAGVTGSGNGAITVAGENNTLEARQFRIENARLPGRDSNHQTVTAWQVSTGTWNGQTLDGLSLVLVHSTNEGRGSAQVNCYVSHEATPAQRDALLSAFMASQPQLFANHGAVQMEPAVITLEVEGLTVILHLGLVA
jgi:hypothetical protein